MKKLCSLLLVFSFVLVGCSSGNDSGNKDSSSNSSSTKESSKEKEKSYLAEVEKVMTVEKTTDSAGNELVIAMLSDDEAEFTYYGLIPEENIGSAESLGVETGSLTYENYTYNYVIDSKKQIYAYKEIANEEIEEEIKAVLKQYNLTIDDLKSALKEKYEMK